MNNIELDKKVKQLVHQNSYTKGYVDMISVLIQLGYLTQTDYHAWRIGKINYLEQVCRINLSKLTLINKSVRKYANELSLKPGKTILKHKTQILRYSKSGDTSLEDSYATRYIDKKRIEELKRK